MKKVLFVTNFFGNGGAARVMSIISDYMSRLKEYDITIVSFIKYDNEYYFPNNTKHIYLKSNNKIKRILELRKIIKQNKFDTIISFEYFINMYTIISNLFLKNKLIISERNDPKQSGDDKRLIRNFLYRFADVLVCQTNEAKDYFPNYIRKKTVVIPNAITDKLPNPYTGKRNKEIITFCRITKQKNLYLLIDAFKKVYSKHNDYILNIYGDGEEKEKINNYIKQNNLSHCINLMPFDKDIHKKILKSKMFVSSSNFEGISNSMIEAMGIGLPTICTDCPCGGARMFIKDHENGILVPVGNCEMLIEAITEIIENPKLEEKISKEAIKIKKILDPEKITKEWMFLINKE